ncbi:MAG: hypothetical protein RAO92_06260 [Candidatus Euphemobacter frigidus]|nr:hypothetical protein [Candidatus Euphemobacter frigidus]MDP8275988.1 hypothetical protein [Candidatus Euphemobacter frigidus]
MEELEPKILIWIDEEGFEHLEGQLLELLQRIRKINSQDTE